MMNDAAFEKWWNRPNRPKAAFILDEIDKSAFKAIWDAAIKSMDGSIEDCKCMRCGHTWIQSTKPSTDTEPDDNATKLRMYGRE